MCINYLEWLIHSINSIKFNFLILIDHKSLIFILDINLYKFKWINNKSIFLIIKIKIIIIFIKIKSFSSGIFIIIILNRIDDSDLLIYAMLQHVLEDEI